jgi:CBS domain-containing protein
MTIRELMSTPVMSCRPDDSLENAARIMWEHDLGAMPVVDPMGRAIGMITDRDLLMGAFFAGSALRHRRVEEVMSRDVVSCRASDDVGVARELMAEHQLHRLPVLDVHGRPEGMITLNDLALEADHERSFLASELRPQDVAFVLAAIATPRQARRSAA